jgi:hypothetical protein
MWLVDNYEIVRLDSVCVNNELVWFELSIYMIDVELYVIGRLIGYKIAS